MLNSRFGHILAVSGTALLHAGVVGWAVQPEPPIAIPQQQVIQVAMIAPPTPKEEVTPVTETPPPLSPKLVGMKKIERKPKKVEIVKPKEQEPEKPKQVAMLTPASGPQATDAQAMNAALTEPLFDADYLRNPPPAYPSAARRGNIEGKVLLKVDVSQEGTAEQVEVARSSGSRLLDEAARFAVEQWRFVPAHRGSEKVAANVIVPIIFKIKEQQ